MIRFVSAIILAITLITPSWVIAASCADDPNECTPKNLCEMTTEVQGGQKVWTSKTEMSKHISFAKQLGMDCGAIDPRDPCDLDANECKISELCEKATIGEDNKQWNSDNPDHVKLAHQYGMHCEVGPFETEPSLRSQSIDYKKPFNSKTHLYRKQVQFALKKLGFYNSGIDGLWGNGTKQAINAYITAEKLQNPDPSQLFSSLFDKVDVPKNFVSTNISKPVQGKGQNKNWFPMTNNPKFSFEKSANFCNAKAAAEERSYISNNKPDDPNSLLAGVEKNEIRREAQKLSKALAEECMAEYGWIKK